jgi:hypothetical protein
MLLACLCILACWIGIIGYGTGLLFCVVSKTGVFSRVIMLILVRVKKTQGLKFAFFVIGFGWGCCFALDRFLLFLSFFDVFVFFGVFLCFFVLCFVVFVGCRGFRGVVWFVVIKSGFKMGLKIAKL